MKQFHRLLFLFGSFFSAFACVHAANESSLIVKFTCGDDKTHCKIVTGQSLNLTISQTVSKSQSITYDFTYGVSDSLSNEPKKRGRYFFDPIPSQTLKDNETRRIVIDTSTGNDTAGFLRIALNNSRLNSLNHVVDLTITRSTWLMVFGSIVGWIYFVAWSVSFYPQCYVNFKRKSVIGLNFDFISLNLTGFTCYAIYNLCLYFNRGVKHSYHERHPLGVIQVEVNDVFFALHAIALTLLTIFQCCIYERGEQGISRVCKALLFGMLLIASVTLILAGANVVSWLDWVQYLSYIKLGITVIKYIPQAYMNYRRKSTDGWSIGNILLDFTGGSLSIVQMFLKSYNWDDWESIFGNPTKFGLGFFSVLFDILFILQHYVFYRKSAPYDEIINVSKNQVRNV